MTLLDSCKTILSAELTTNEQLLSVIGSVNSFKDLAQLYFREYGDMDGFILLLDKARVDFYEKRLYIR